MQEALVVRRESHIPAPPAAVFAFLTDPGGFRWPKAHDQFGYGRSAGVHPQLPARTQPPGRLHPTDTFIQTWHCRCVQLSPRPILPAALVGRMQPCNQIQGLHRLNTRSAQFGLDSTFAWPSRQPRSSPAAGNRRGTHALLAKSIS
jgi:hypothetical protein